MILLFVTILAYKSTLQLCGLPEHVDIYHESKMGITPQRLQYFEKVLVQVVGGTRATKSLLLTYVYGGPEGSHMQIKNVAAK